MKFREMEFKMKIINLESIWEEFENIPINKNDEIEQDFYFWEKGTYRFDIWNWFDEKLPNGVAKWLYCPTSKIESIEY
jgi:hypothetical protein